MDFAITKLHKTLRGRPGQYRDADTSCWDFLSRHRLIWRSGAAYDRRRLVPMPVPVMAVGHTVLTGPTAQRYLNGCNRPSPVIRLAPKQPFNVDLPLPAASRLPFVSIGAPSADSMSARATTSPLQMPDIRLHAFPLGHSYRSVSLLLAGVHIRRLAGSLFTQKDPHQLRDCDQLRKTTAANSTKELRSRFPRSEPACRLELFRPARRSSSEFRLD
jgi:hypothetical protein